MGVILDYTRRIAPAALKAADAEGVSRYLSYPEPLRKTIGPAEYDELIANQFSVTLNWEYDSRDWMGGQGAGLSHGSEAVRQAKALGYPAGSVIQGSADFDMTRAQWDAAGAGYAIGFARLIRGAGFRPGVYGPWDVLQWVQDSGYMDAFWQAGMSISWSGGRNRRPWPGAHLRQLGHRSVAGTDTDYSEILIRPLWGAKGNDVTLYMAAVTDPTTNQTNWYVGDKIWYRSVQTWPEHQDYLALGVV